MVLSTNTTFQRRGIKSAMVLQRLKHSLSLMIRLIIAEFTKISRTRSLVLFLIAPAIVVTLAAFTIGHPLDRASWQIIWQSALYLWSSFVFPLYIAIIATRINGNDHQNQTWRLMLTLPIRPCHLYFAKLFVEWALLASANLILILVYSAGLLVSIKSDPIGFMPENNFIMLVAGLSLVFLPVLFIQHSISWFTSNTTLPLTLGTLLSFAAGPVNIGFSEQGWLYYPWDYGLRFINNKLDIVTSKLTIHFSQCEFLGLTLGSFIIACLLIAPWLNRRDIH